ncbi:S24 family peptidase [Porphyromonas circumdentaria]|uniref:Phage repressor protein C, contains Cro/C1-type HTH and peptisase s24 domains n=1 Tax=Porphyromonas circumdentaria TaxID=29524 RepID=A0A1T4LPG0_9PORP|nr:S24 family peptidase [Porphyromonas circumdentaria]MBB6275506.1 phage repressor protein C with HTH and peptisase S24 domain [Porphyromonas circumdentaria]SJZ56354.1 Phage repressor protein C, contains Cro/C1-type HTH and peptisase s24 domains [Porphyromonas circumdentaria]
MTPTPIEISPVKLRLLQFIRHIGISIKAFEGQCGLSNGYISSMRVGIGSEKLDDILRHYPDLNRRWLLYGEGRMLLSQQEEAGEGSALLTDQNSLKYYYLMSATASNIEGIEDSEQQQPYTRINFPGYEGCVGFNVTGDSMYPTAKEKDIVVVSPERVDTIINGEVYLVVTRDGQRMIKRLCIVGQDEESGPIIRCISDNENQTLYAPFEIFGANIHNIFRVKGFISNTLLA